MDQEGRGEFKTPGRGRPRWLRSASGLKAAPGQVLLSLLLALLLLARAELVPAAEEPVAIVVQGVEGEAVANVREALALPSGLTREGKLDRLWLERYARQSEQQVLAALEPFGYYNATASAVLETVGQNRYRLLVQVTPGPPVRLEEVTVAVRGPGEREVQLQDLTAAFPLSRGDVLLHQPYEKAKGELSAAARELGYLDADFPVHEIRVLKSESTARITLVLETGPRYFFNGVTIEGAQQYPEGFLRRHLAFKPGESFSYSKLGESQLNFTNSERFREVVVTPEREKTRDLHVPVLVRLKPLPRRSLRPGVGYGTDTRARFTIRYRDLNTFRLGHDFTSNIYVSERLQGFSGGYTIPSSKDVRSSTTLQLNLQRNNATTYTSRFVAMEIARNRSLGKGKIGTVYLRVQQENFTIGAQDDTSRLVLPGVRLTVDRYDDLVRPRRGYRYALDLRGTDHILGSTARLIQLVTDASCLVPLPWRLSLHLRGKGGVTMLSDPVADFPPSLRFFAGGDQSVRGYSYQTLGPTDITGQVVGGKQLVTGSVELERSLFEDWGVSLFYDTGNAFNSFTDVHLFKAAGVGVHYYTRVGALNVAVARQIGVDDPRLRVHFTVGFEF